MSSRDHVLLAELHRRLRADNWKPGYTRNCWRQNNVHIAWDKAELTLEIQDYTDVVTRHTSVYVESVQQAIDVLVALDWLPTYMRTKWPSDDITIPSIKELAEGLSAAPMLLSRDPEPTRCPDCCAEDEDPLLWCRCRRGEECAGRCRQRAHDPHVHTLSIVAS